MPHISKRKIHSSIKVDANSRLFSLLIEEGSYLRKKVFSELFTYTERIMLLKRIALLLLISKGHSIYAISELLGMSTSTVKRFYHSTQIGKYKETLRWLKKIHLKNKILRQIVKLVAIPFEARRESLGKVFREL